MAIPKKVELNSFLPRITSIKFQPNFKKLTNNLVEDLTFNYILHTKNISEDKNKPCYKTSIKNINIFLDKNDIYNNSKNKLLIEENINDFICEYGQSESESISNMKEKIKYNVEMYANMKNNNKDIDRMSQIFFEILSDINNELS